MNKAFYHSSNAVLMVRPVDFEFNTQTALDNEFMKYKEGVTDLALQEFDASVEILRREGIHVVVLDYQSDSVKTPDAVFPNNWFGTTRNGQLIVYTMAAESRRAETLRLNHVQQLLAKEGFHFDSSPITLSSYLGGTDSDIDPDHVLEGTGAFVIDHYGGVLYAAKSCRCSPKALQKYMQIRGSDLSEAVMFETASSNGKEIYHANVMLSIGSHFAVVCEESILETPVDSRCLGRSQVMSKLANNREVISISLKQAEQSFCANILEVRSANNETLIVMSASAFNGFTEEQRMILSKYGKLVALPINNGIEYVGGGSARCMLAEIFLPKQEQVATELTLEAIYWFLKTNQAPLNTQVATDHVSPVFETVYENMLNTTV
jgi:hypothetical protein